MNPIDKRILIVEDDVSLAQSLQQTFSREGFEVVCARNGSDALKEYKPDTFKAILLDLMIPNIDGFGVMRQLKMLGNKTPVIVMSILALEINIKEAKQLGATHYFVKSKTPMAEIVDYVKNIALQPVPSRPLGGVIT